MLKTDNHYLDSELKEFLGSEQGVIAFETQDHLNFCVQCQTRLEQLAANQNDWSAAKESLAVSSNEDNESWNDRHLAESLAQQILGPASHPEMLGRLGRYEVERLVGSGGMGVVFKAFDSELHRPVAIKALAPHLASSSSARQRFNREARAAAAIVHDHVVPIYNVEAGQPTPYLVMQFIGGDSLQALIDRDGIVELVEILRISKQIAAGLAAAHAQGLVHRDVKPSNILLDENVSRALLTDFGLARARDDAFLTRSGFHPGTPHYMSPEQVRGESLDGRSDLFGLGCTMYAMCTGHPPFVSETGYAVMRCIAEDKTPSICESNHLIPYWLDRIVMKLLEKNPNDRYQSATEVEQLLESCIAHLQAPTSNHLPDDLQHRLTLRVASSWFRGNFGRIMACLLFIFGATFGGVFIVLESRKGTLTITSEQDGVPIKISQNDKVVENLVVNRAGESIRVSSGEYTVEIEGDFEDVKLTENKVEIQNGKENQIKIVQAIATVPRPSDPRATDPRATDPRATDPRATDPRPAHPSPVKQPTTSASPTLVGKAAAVLIEEYIVASSKLAPDHPKLRAMRLSIQDLRQQSSPPWNDSDLIEREGELRALQSQLESTMGSNHPRRIELALRREILSDLRAGDMKQLDRIGSKLVPSSTGTENGVDLPKAPLPTVPQSTEAATVIRSDWEVKEVFSPAHDQMVWAVAFTPDGKTIASAGADKKIKLWDAASGMLRSTSLRPVNCTDVTFSPNGKYMAIAGGDDGVNPEGEIVLLKTDNGKEEYVLESHESAQYSSSVAFSSDSKWLASGGNDNLVKIWSVEQRELEHNLTGHTGLVSQVAFAPNGKILASASFDHTVKLWSVPDGNAIATLRGHEKEVRGIAFSPDGQLLVSVGEDCTVRVWNTTSFEQLRVMDDHTGPVFSVAFSPDGQHFVSGSQEPSGGVKIWEVDTRKSTTPVMLPRQKSEVVSLAFSPDGQMLAIVGSWNGFQILNRRVLAKTPGLNTSAGAGESTPASSSAEPLKGNAAIQLYEEYVIQSSLRGPGHPSLRDIQQRIQDWRNRGPIWTEDELSAREVELRDLQTWVEKSTSPDHPKRAELVLRREVLRKLRAGDLSGLASLSRSREPGVCNLRFLNIFAGSDPLVETQVHQAVMEAGPVIAEELGSPSLWENVELSIHVALAGTGQNACSITLNPGNETTQAVVHVSGLLKNIVNDHLPTQLRGAAIHVRLGSQSPGWIRAGYMQLGRSQENRDANWSAIKQSRENGNGLGLNETYLRTPQLQPDFFGQTDAIAMLLVQWIEETKGIKSLLAYSDALTMEKMDFQVALKQRLGFDSVEQLRDAFESWVDSRPISVNPAPINALGN